MTDRRLGKHERLTKRRDIDRLFTKGVRRSSGGLCARALRNGLGYARLGVGVSSRMCNAVKRNRLKRLIREAFRLHKDEVPKGLDIFFTHTKADSTFDDVETNLLDVARKLGEVSWED